MQQPSSIYEMTRVILQKLLYRIQRRTNEDYAINVLTTAVNQLKEKNDFFQYVHIVDFRENDDFNHVRIDEDINSYSSDRFFNAIDELFKTTIQILSHVADYFFIREFKKSLGPVLSSYLSDGGVNLDLMQSNYILEQQEMYHIENNDLYEDVITALIKILNQNYSKNKTIEVIFSILSNLEKRYSFLKYVQVSELPDSEKSVEVRVYPDINKVWSLKIGESIQELLSQTKSAMQYRNENTTFEHLFQRYLGNSQLTILERIGVNFNRLRGIREHIPQKELTEAVLHAIIKFVGSITTVGFSVSLLDTVTNRLKDDHDILSLIIINKTKYHDGMNAITLDDRINNVKPHILGKALRDIIKGIGGHLPYEDKISYIDGIKNHLGDDVLNEFDSLGINLHIIELQYNL